MTKTIFEEMGGTYRQVGDHGDLGCGISYDFLTDLCGYIFSVYSSFYFFNCQRRDYITAFFLRQDDIILQITAV